MLYARVFILYVRFSYFRLTFYPVDHEKAIFHISVAANICERADY